MVQVRDVALGVAYGVAVGVDVGVALGAALGVALVLAFDVANVLLLSLDCRCEEEKASDQICAIFRCTDTRCGIGCSREVENTFSNIVLSFPLWNTPCCSTGLLVS